MFQPGICTKLWVCEECAYSLCKPCMKVYSKDYWAGSKPYDMNNAADARFYKEEELGYDQGEEEF